MSDKNLVRSLPYLLGVVAAGTGVTIKTDPNADTAGTDGKVIYFPPLPYVGEELAVYALGFLVHEAGHIRNSDFEVFTGRNKTPLLKMLVNIIEDVRIERLIIGTYPGARHWLNALTTKLVEAPSPSQDVSDAPLASVMLSYLWNWLFESVLGYTALKGVGEKMRQRWQSMVSPELGASVEKLALDAAWSSSTTEVADACEKIIALISEEAKKSAAKPKQSEKSDKPMPGTPDADSQPGQNEQSSPQDPEASGADVQNQDEVDQQYAQSLKVLLGTEDLPQGADRGDIIRQELESAIEGKKGSSISGVQSNFLLPNVLSDLGTTGPHVDLGKVRQASSALQFRMEEFLQANTAKRYSISNRGNRLNRDAGRRLSLCDDRIFQVRASGKKIDTAVHVLIDMSSSMSKNERSQVALDTALALGLALSEVEGVKYSVSAFPFQSHDVVELVKTGESLRNVAYRFGMVAPGGSTPLDKGLLHAHTALMTTRASRRVCLVITDGEPDDEEASKLVIKLGEEMGIEHMAIGIECSVSHITRNGCVVMKLDDLPKQVIGMMQEVILLQEAA